MSSVNDPLGSLRIHIDQTDKELLQVLAERMMLVAQVGRHKKEKGLNVRDEARRSEVLRSRIALGKECGLTEDLVGELFEVILNHAEKLEEK